MVDMTTENPVNEISAIRRYHVNTLYSVQALIDAIHWSVESKQSAWKARLSMSSSKKISP